MPTPSRLAYFESLADLARPRDDSDYGSDRQVGAENLLFVMLEVSFPETFAEESAFSAWSLKATTEERLAEAMRLVRSGSAR